jgi:molecular chaperone GrpE
MGHQEDITRAGGETVAAGEPEAPVSPAVAEQDPPEKPEHPQQPERPDAEPETPGAPGEPEAPMGPSETPPAGPTTPAPPPTHNQADEDHEQRLERDLEELTAKAEKADEYLELAKRTKADFENYRKRATREAAAAQERGVARLARELLPAVDNLDRAVEAAEGAGENGNLLSGIKLVHADVLAALQRAGIERYSPEGEAFDPQRHEAVAQQPVEGAEPGTIVEVYQRGYLLGDSVIRPARVVVAG